MKNATGEYIWFIDSDDCILESEAAERLYNYANTNKLSLVLFDGKCIFENPKIEKNLGKVERSGQDNYAGILSGEEMFARQMPNGGFISMTQLYFINRSWLLKSKLRFAPVLHEDMLFSIQALLSAERVGYIRNTYYEYYRREASITTMDELAPKRAASCAFIIDELYSWLRNMGLTVELSHALYIYFNVLKKMLVDQVLLCIRRNVCITFYSSFEEILTDMIMEERYPLISKNITFELFSKITEAESIIVYGAGNVSKSVQKFLMDIKFENYAVAVTSEKRDGVMLLAELEKSALVVIAVSAEKKDEMLQYAMSLGFHSFAFVS